MARAIPLVRLLGIRVTIDPSWFLIFLLVAWSLAEGYLPGRLPGAGAVAHWMLAAILSAALFGSVLAHEFSHALVARARRVEVDEIMLFIFGGVAKMRSEPRDARTEFLIAAAGPALSIALGASLLVVARALATGLPEVAVVGLTYLGFINIALAVFNLVPGFPLDGGRILRAILWWRTGDFERATVGAARTGQAIAGLLILAGVVLVALTGDLSWLWEVLIGWFLWSAASRSIRLARLREAVEGIPIRDVMTRRVPAIRADQDVRVGQTQVRAGSGTPQIAVVERDGRLVGVVSPDALEDAASSDPERPARDVAEPADDDQIVAPDDGAGTLLERLAGLGERLLLVVDGDTLIGTVDPRALLATLGEADDDGDGPATLPRR